MSRGSRRGRLVVALIAGCVPLLGAAVYLAARPAGPLPAPPETATVRVSDQTPVVAGGRRDVFPFDRVVVLTIAVDRYPNALSPCDLRHPESDAKALARVLADHFAYEVVPLLGPDATRDRIWAALDRYGAELGERDALIVYFAGHGNVVEMPGAGEAGYFVSFDAAVDIRDKKDYPRWERQAVNMRRLVERVEAMRAGHVLVIADSCFSGFLTTTRGVLGWDQRQFLARRSRVALAATTRDQTARDGRFTAKLIEQLTRLDPPNQRPTAASVYDLFEPLRKVVSDESEGHMQPQVAHVGEGDGMFVFIPAAVDRKLIEKDLKALKVSAFTDGDDGPVVAAGRRHLARLQHFTTPAEVYEALDAPDSRGAADAEGRKRVWEPRFERFLRNAQSGDGWAMGGLHLCYAKGLGTDRSPELAYHWARQADRARHPAGLGRYLLGRCHEYGLGVSVTGAAADDVSRRLYRESAEAGFPLGRRAVAIHTLASDPPPAEARKAREELRALVDADVTVAEPDLGDELLKDRPGVPADKAEGRRLLERAAARDSPFAHRLLARAYVFGTPHPTPDDLKKAEYHLRRAADLGLAEAVTELGFEYCATPAARLGLARDDRRAFTLIDRGAQMGYPPALVESARMLGSGRGTDPNPALAKERLEEAVRAGSREADFTQGVWYFDGFVLPKSDRDALQCFKRAADKGDPNGCFMAGHMYCEGRGFKVRPRWTDNERLVLFHQDWAVGLHYLTRAYKLGVHGERQKDYLGTALRGFKAALAEDERTFAGCYPAAANGGKNEVERQFWFLLYITAASTIAADWEFRNPDSYAWFRKESGLDAETGREGKAVPAGKE